MPDQPRTPSQPADPGAKWTLRLVPEPADSGVGGAARPRTIGRLIAQTALIADSAVTRRRVADTLPTYPGRGGRLLGRFR